MNCQETALLLDDRDIRRLNAAALEAVQSHLSSCAECSAVWDAHARVLAKAVPAMRRELAQSVWRSLQAAGPVAGSSRRRYVRPTLLGLVLAAAAAAMLTFESPLEESVSAVARSGWTPAPSEIEARPSGTTAIPPFEGTMAGQVADGQPTLAPAKRMRLLVLPTLYEVANPAARDYVDATRAEFVRFLRDHTTDVEIVELTEPEEARVSTYLASLVDAFEWIMNWGDPPRPRSAHDAAVARHFGADYAVRFASLPPDGDQLPDDWRVRFTDVRQRGGGGSGIFWGSQTDDDPRRFGARQARQIYGNASLNGMVDSATNMYAGLIADPRYSDRERLEFLREAWSRPRLPVRVRASSDDDAVVVAAAAEWGRSATVPETRARIWQALDVASHPSAAQPLMDALSTDRDAAVRAAAARGLRKYSTDARVQAVLASAAAGDPSRVVRLEARWILSSDTERRALLETTLRDRSLPAEERVAALLLANASSPAIYDAVAAPDAEAMALLAEAVRRNGDADTRRRAQYALRGSPLLVDPLLDNLDDSDTDMRVEAALTLLNTYRDVPGVLEAVQRAYANESEDSRFRRAVGQALAAPP